MTRIALLIGSILLAGGAIGGFAFLVSAIDTSVNEIATLKGATTSAGKRAALFDSAQKFLDETALERAELDAFVAGSRDIVAAIEVIEAEAKDEGVTLTVSSVTEIPEAEWKQHELVRLELSAVGTFENLAAFSTALENLPFASRLSNVKFDASAQKSWFGKYIVFVVASTAL